MNIARAALRNFQRRPWRSAMLVAGIGATTAVMLVWGTLSKGFTESLSRAATSLELGEFQLHHPHYLASEDPFDLIEPLPETLAKLRAAGFHASPRLFGAALASVDELASGVRITGMAVDDEKTVTSLHEHLADGAWLAAGDLQGVVIGKLLAKQLGATPGKELIILGQAADGSVASGVFQVKGILQSVSSDVDNRGVYMPEAAFREVFLVPSGAHEVAITRASASTWSLDEAGTRLSALRLSGEVKSWRQLKPLLARTLDLLSITVYFTLTFTYVALGGMVLNSTFMTISSRRKEYGVMQAIGMTPQQITLLILAETMWMAVFAAVFAVSMGVPTAYWLAAKGIDFSYLIERMSIAGVAIEPVLYARIGLRQVLAPVLFLLGAMPLFALYPALEAAATPPLKALGGRP